MSEIQFAKGVGRFEENINVAVQFNSMNKLHQLNPDACLANMTSYIGNRNKDLSFGEVQKMAEVSLDVICNGMGKGELKAQDALISEKELQKLMEETSSITLNYDHCMKA